MGDAGTAGWIGRVVSEQDKERKMRRHLYKELADNYATLHEAVHSPAWRTNLKKDSLLPYPLRMKYFAHAQKDMGAFHDLSDSGPINDVYEGLTRINAMLGDKDSHDLVWQVQRTLFAIEEAAVSGFLNEKLLEKNAPKWIRERLEAGIAKRREDLKDVPLVP